MSYTPSTGTHQQYQAHTSSIRHTPTVLGIHQQYQAHTISTRHTPAVPGIHQQYQAYTSSIRHIPAVSGIHQQYQAYTSSIRHTPAVWSTHQQHKAHTSRFRQLFLAVVTCWCDMYRVGYICLTPICHIRSHDGVLLWCLNVTASITTVGYYCLGPLRSENAPVKASNSNWMRTRQPSHDYFAVWIVHSYLNIHDPIHPQYMLSISLNDIWILQKCRLYLYISLMLYVN